MEDCEHPTDVAPVALARDAKGGEVHFASDWRVNNFDLIRLLAALQVAVVHALSHFGPPPGSFLHHLGSALSLLPGVPVFFVVSGLLISRSYEQSSSLHDYLRNRCLRIFPALWVCLVVTVSVMLAIGVGVLGPVSTGAWLLWWAAQMSMFQSYSAPFLSSLQGLNPSLWTIPVELEFYLALPVLYWVARLRRRRGNVALLVLLGASLLTQWTITYPASTHAASDWLVLTLFPYLWMFLVGILIQRNWALLRGVLANRAHWWLLAYLLACVAGLVLHIRVTAGTVVINPVCLLILAGLIASSAVSVPELARWILRGHDVSYGLYIYHALAIILLVHYGAPPGWLSLGATISVSLAAAAVSWLLIERPFLARKRLALHPVAEPGKRIRGRA
jgi:peptidoglycan/LPS O-acetylase OafA/YrhL